MPASGKHNGFYETWKRYDCCELVASLERRRELFLITAAMVPAICELDLGDDVGIIEDRGILARIEGWAGVRRPRFRPAGDGHLRFRRDRQKPRAAWRAVGGDANDHQHVPDAGGLPPDDSGDSAGHD